jgi:uncharacterized protein YcaQ
MLQAFSSLKIMGIRWRKDGWTWMNSISLISGGEKNNHSQSVRREKPFAKQLKLPFRTSQQWWEQKPAKRRAKKMIRN